MRGPGACCAVNDRTEVSRLSGCPLGDRISRSGGKSRKSVLSCSVFCMKLWWPLSCHPQWGAQNGPKWSTCIQVCPRPARSQELPSQQSLYGTKGKMLSTLLARPPTQISEGTGVGRPGFQYGFCPCGHKAEEVL